MSLEQIQDGGFIKLMVAQQILVGSAVFRESILNTADLEAALQPSSNDLCDGGTETAVNRMFLDDNDPLSALAEIENLLRLEFLQFQNRVEVVIYTLSFNHTF